LVLVGESGSGKTTVLRMLAGLATPDAGRIAWKGGAWYDGETAVAVPAWRRPLAYVAQDYCLFPHLTVFENIAFGLRNEGRSAAEVRRRVGTELERFQLTPLAARKPGQLSGGQQQRTALARALVLDPLLLLLDEPLAALDLTTRRVIRTELRAVLRTLTCATVFVTHSPIEAMLFGDQIVVMDQGRTLQAGTRDDLLRHPRSRYIAEFMGVNLFQGRMAPGRDGLACLITLDGEISVVDPGDLVGEVYASVSPREITLHQEAPAGSAQNVFEGRVTEIIAEPPHGERVRVALGTHPMLVAEVTKPAVDALGLREGRVVYASFKASGVIPYR
jgi:molybdate transport system ATP-binding protein